MGDLTDDEIGAHRLEYLETCLVKRWQVPAEDIALMIKEIVRRRAAQTASADLVRAVVREYAIRIIGGYLGAGLSSASTEAVADAIAGYAVEQLTEPPPGHVCPVPYGLGPEDLDALEWLSGLVSGGGAILSAEQTALGKILAAHRAPEATIAPRLPEVVTCGAEGCLSSIKKHLLPAGWLLLEGAWRCPRCKVITTSEAS